MNTIQSKITEKFLICAGANLIKKRSESIIYEIGNQKYIIENGKVIHSFYFNDNRLRKRDK